MDTEDVKKLQIGLYLSFVARNLFWRVYEDHEDLWSDGEEDPRWQIEACYQTAIYFVNAFVPPRKFEDYSTFELMNLIRKDKEDPTDYVMVQLMRRLRKGVANDFGSLSPEEQDLIKSVAMQVEFNKVFEMLSDEIFTSDFIAKFGGFLK